MCLCLFRVRYSCSSLCLVETARDISWSITLSFGEFVCFFFFPFIKEKKKNLSLSHQFGPCNSTAGSQTHSLSLPIQLYNYLNMLFFHHSCIFFCYSQCLRVRTQLLTRHTISLCQAMLPGLITMQSMPLRREVCLNFSMARTNQKLLKYILHTETSWLTPTGQLTFFFRFYNLF